ncbi:MAG: beta-aspartyl-peptidase [Sphaerochaetaceae bacterium]|jgi:beta-aspartyl-dipeptidase (metallo-type)|nr:beta-aspartyl-peptidase [Sphaerochaetaceae bacterium]
MMYLLKNAHLLAPEDNGIQDILICNDRIAAVGRRLDRQFPSIMKEDLKERIICPALIDQHVHVIGGGGEAGPESRVPPLSFSECIDAGVGTIVGLLGTDSRTRSLSDLLAATKALNRLGITAYCLTGAYEYPSPVMTGSVGDDIVLIQEVLGVKLAISDHRCSHPTIEEIFRLASEVRIAGMLAGKLGVVHFHVGREDQGIDQLLHIAKNTSLPIGHLRPTHMGGHVDQGIEFMKNGGYVDITTSSKSAVEAALRYLGENSRLLTMSSDSNGSMPKWDNSGHVIGITRGRLTENMKTISALHANGVPLSQVLTTMTSNVADAMGFSQKGRIAEGKDADILVLDDSLKIESMMAHGVWLRKDGVNLRKGVYED